MRDFENMVNEEEPKTNFFLFPPIKPVQQLSHEQAMQRLELDKRGDSRAFVAFLALPFCRVRCHSCHCFKHILPRGMNEGEVLDHYVSALCAQIRGFGATERFSGKVCDAIYFGGGTASLLRPRHMEMLLRTIRESFALRYGLEITLEGSPLEFTGDYLQDMRDVGITRLSIGYQSRFDELLEVLNSPHRSKVGEASIEAAIRTGFDQVNVDLLYNIPRQTRSLWEADVESLIDYGLDSISIGDYMIFPSSPAEKLIQTGRNPNQLPQAEVFDWFEWSSEQLDQAGYYEQVRGIFPKKGLSHDYVETSCLKNSEIVGIGTGAYSFIAGYQLRNIMNVADYVDSMLTGDFLMFDNISRASSDRDLRIRFIIHNFFASRLQIADYAGRFGTELISDFGQQINELERRAFITVKENELELTRDGRLHRKHVYQQFYEAA